MDASVVVDTGPIVAMLDPREANHEWGLIADRWFSAQHEALGAPAPGFFLRLGNVERAKPAEVRGAGGFSSS